MKNNKVFVFIAGVEGSGTTLLLRMLAALPGGVALGGAYHSRQYGLHRWLMNRVTDRLWAYPTRPRNKSAYLGLIKFIFAIVAARYVVYKRSYPFNDMSYFPDMLDFTLSALPYKIIIMGRSLESNAKSILRRGFVKTLDEAKERTAEAIRLLDEQALSVPSANVLRIRYEDLIDPARKNKVLRTVAAFLPCEESELLSLSAMVDKPTTSAG